MIRTLFLLALLGGCQAYRNNFDTFACRGMDCSVTQIESRIVENPDGADYLACCPHRQSHVPVNNFGRRKVWMADTTTEDGYAIQGHYVWEPS